MLVDRDTLYFPSDHETGGYVWAIDRRTGRERWRATTSAAEKRSGFTTNLLRDANVIITISGVDELVAFDAATGMEKWRTQLEPTGTDRRSSAALDGHRVWVMSGPELVAFDASSGHEVHRIALGSNASTSVAAANGSIYVGLENRDLVSVRGDGGAITARFRLAAPAFGRPAVIGHSVLVLTRAAELVALDARLHKQLWRRTAKEWGSPQVEAWRGLALAGTSEGDIFALEPATGNVVKSWRVSGYVRGISSDERRIYAGTLSGDVFAIESARDDRGAR
jgi:eukaryotic-like serine/threonine-protein kinase